MSVATRWILPPPPPPAVSDLAGKLGISPITAACLARRVGVTQAAARSFLRPHLGQLHSPWLLPDMEVAATRLARAVRTGERVVIYGDYDADGVTATALMVRVLQALGLTVEAHLPSRLTEGYGISDEFVQEAAARKLDLVVTVDCGTTEHKRIAQLRAKGVEVVVTDHHEPGGEELPPALAVVNPKRRDSSYPFRGITGVGVAFKLAWAVCEKVVGAPKVGERLRTILLDLLPLVAIGTVADVAPLVDENRVYTVFGMRGLRRPLAGLQALMEECGKEVDGMSARDISFALAPRLNAAGRMGDAGLALALLLEDVQAAAARLAGKLEQHNNSRQRLCRATLKAARAMVEATHDLEQASAIVVAGEGWHEGVIGIVAGRLADTLHKPSVVIALDPDNGKGRGSARGVEGLNLFAAMNRSRERFLSFGGHEQAAGFSIRRDQVDALRRELDAACREQVREHGSEKPIEVDALVALAELNRGLLSEFKLLEPCGHGNPAPRLLARAVEVAGTPRLLGQDNRHFSFMASQAGCAYRAVVFNRTSWLHAMDAGERTWDLVFTPRINEFRGQSRLELEIVDMRPAQRAS